MTLEQLHQYLGDLIEAGTDKRLTVLLPGVNDDDNPQELTDARLIKGIYYADPSPKMSAYRLRTGDGLLLGGLMFDMDTLKDTHTPVDPLVDAPQGMCD